jgi:hypothetical protein
VEQSQLGLGRWHEREANGGAEEVGSRSLIARHLTSTFALLGEPALTAEGPSRTQPCRLRIADDRRAETQPKLSELDTTARCRRPRRPRL